MNTASAILGDSLAAHPLRDKFLKWQCRTRLMMMRDGQGRPDASIMPDVLLEGQDFGAVITILNKSPSYSVTPELLHMARKTNDPAQIRDQALQYFAATHYQKHREFSDILTATFVPGSAGAAKIRAVKTCRLVFEIYAQRFDLHCRVWSLADHNALHQATMAHNRLFNPGLPGATIVLAFEPDWATSTATP